MADAGHIETEKRLRKLEKRLQKEYQQASIELQEKIDDYWQRYKVKDEIWQRRLAKGEVTASEYADWKKGQIIVGKRWESMKEEIAEDMMHTNQIASGIIADAMPDIYAINLNYGTYQVETAAMVDTSYTLYSRDAVNHILGSDADVLPPKPGKKVAQAIAEGKMKKWEKQQIQSVALQSILQGESIPNMAKRIANTLGELNHKDSIRYARTAATGVQNAGRLDSYVRAKEMGIDLKQEWSAVLDERTRHEHRQLDGQVQEVGTPFKVGNDTILYPGDPSAPGYLVWNCRCTLEPVIKGWTDQSKSTRSMAKLNGMSYEEWKKGHSESRPIDYQEKVGQAIKYSYIKELYRGK